MKISIIDSYSEILLKDLAFPYILGHIHAGFSTPVTARRLSLSVEVPTPRHLL